MFQQKKIYKTMENRKFTPDSLRDELEDLKKGDFEEVSYTGLNLNLDMLMTQNIRDDDFQLIAVEGGLAKKTFANWQADLVTAISIYNQFADYTKKHFKEYLRASEQYQAETGNPSQSIAYKDYFEQGNVMYFHDVLHSVFDISRRLDLSIEDFTQALLSAGKNAAEFHLPEKIIFSEK